MVNVTQEKLLKLLFFCYLVLFPFGQLLHGLYLTDLIVAVIGIITLFRQKEVLNPKGMFVSLLIIGTFSILFSVSLFNLPQIITGTLYFVRLVSYVLLYFFVRKNYSDKKEKTYLINSLLIINVFIIIFGLIQYFFIPDIRFLKDIGWDDHYFRLVSTFLDPTFTGIILLIGLILALSKKYYFLGLINLVAIALTYSRSTFVSLIISLIYFFIVTKRKVILIFPILLLISIPILPRPSSEGVKLERTYSIFQKFEDYRRANLVSLKSPIIGFGFNNVCGVKQLYFGERNPRSHSCSGIDNSVLFVLVTTGIIGFIFFIQVLTMVKWKSTFGVVLVAVLVHSMFTNTFFYPFVMGLVAILAALKE